MEAKVAPGLLLSMPHLLDPNFTRAVVLMVEHSEEGSFGLVVNQPSDLAVAELLEQLDIDWRGADDAVVWSGGPVTPSTGWVLHEPIAGLVPDEDGSMVDVAPGIVLSTSPEILRDIAAAPPRRVRFLLGYAGWGPGQLAHEMVRGSWLHAAPSPEIIFDTPADEMWERAVRSVGVDPEALIPGQGVH
ncbi:MAG: YqgE/AlgH family protein [Deltaproteobacteria bacterium]|nr:MAG: YqgE/AlgH family protein [Deltaproteobacteria bacterium]